MAVRHEPRSPLAAQPQAEPAHSGAGARLRRARKLVRGPWLPITLLVLLGTAVMIGLGFWQLDRLLDRRAANALIAQRRAEPAVTIDAGNAGGLDAAALDERRVVVAGTWDYDHEVLVRRGAYQGAPGYHVLTPLRIDGGDRVLLVDRGWLPYAEAGPEERRAFRKGERGQVEGFAHQPRVSGATSPGPATGGPSGNVSVWPRVDLASIQRELPYPTLPIWVEQLPMPGNTDLPKPDPNLTLDNGPHLGYMIQWWAFALILLIGYIALATQPNAERGARNAEQDA